MSWICNFTLCCTLCVCSGAVFAPETQRDLATILQIQDPCTDLITAISTVTQKVGTRTHFTRLCTFKLETEDCKLVLFRGSNRAADCAKMGKELTNIFCSFVFPFRPPSGMLPDKWVTVEGRFRCVSLTCMSSSCPRSPLGLSPSAHLADGTGDLILVWNTNPLGFLKYLYRHTSAQDQVGACGTVAHLLHIYS